VGYFAEIRGFVQTANTCLGMGNALTSCRLVTCWGLFLLSRQDSLRSGIVSDSIGSSGISVSLWLVVVVLFLLLDLSLA
jgi:hypothetical protein